MFNNTKAFSGFAVDDVDKAREFYGETLGLNTSVENDLLTLHIAGDRPTLAYPRPDHKPAEYTILNFPVEDIEAAVDELVARGVSSSATRASTRTTGDQPRRPPDRLVQGPGRQRAVRHPARLEPLADPQAEALEQPRHAVGLHPSP